MDPENYTNCTIVIDAASIKKHQQLVLSEWRVEEVVDLRGDIEYVDMLANIAIFLMVVGIREMKSPSLPPLHRKADIKDPERH